MRAAGLGRGFSLSCSTQEEFTVLFLIYVYVQYYTGTSQRPNPKKNMVYMGPYAGDDYNNNPTLYTLQSGLQHIYHGQPYAIVDLTHGIKKIIWNGHGYRQSH